MVHDPVNHPSHYTSSPAACACGRGIECIQVTEHMDFLLGNVTKYVWRTGHKGGVQDLEKAAWYLDRAISQRKETPTDYPETAKTPSSMKPAPGPTKNAPQASRPQGSSPAPDLAHTVIEQDETIKTLSRLLAGAEEAATERAAQIADLFQEVNDLFEEIENHHHDLLRVMEERNQQAEKIKRLQESLREAMEDSEIGRDHYPEDYCTGRIHAFAMALRLIKEIQGDTDE